MKILLLTILCCLGSNANAVIIKTAELCYLNKCNKIDLGTDLYKQNIAKNNIEKALYRISFMRNDIQKCAKSDDCWIFLGEVADTVFVSLNSHVLNKTKLFSDYVSSYFYLPAEYLRNSNSIEIEVSDLNETRFGILSPQILIGNIERIFMYAGWDWFSRTGATLFSAFTLLIVSFTLVSIFTIRRGRGLIPIILFSFFSAIYLISFSSIPRSFFDPVLMSGPIHFSLRLFVDLFTVIVALNLYKTASHNKWIRFLPFIYIVLILLMLLSAAIRSDYLYFKNIMLFCAPLVTMGTFCLFNLSSQYYDKEESQITTPVFFIFFLFQIHDLFVFWQLIDNHFLVKIYLPFLVMLFIWITIFRANKNEQLIRGQALIGVKLEELSHDILSPLDQVMDIIEKENNDSFFLKEAINEVSIIARGILVDKVTTDHNDLSKINIINVFKILNTLYDKSKISIVLKLNTYTGEWISFERDMVIRFFKNLVDNSIKAGSTFFKCEVSFVRNQVTFDLSDNGTGVDRCSQPYIFERGFSLNSSYGVGLSFVSDYSKKINGRFYLNKSDASGTVFQLQIPIPKMIVLDDNKLLLDNWRSEAESLGLSFESFSPSDFINENISVDGFDFVFIDYNFGILNGIDVANVLSRKGSNNLYIITTDTRAYKYNYPVIGKRFPFQKSEYS